MKNKLRQTYKTLHLYLNPKTLRDTAILNWLKFQKEINAKNMNESIKELLYEQITKGDVC